MQESKSILGKSDFCCFYFKYLQDEMTVWFQKTGHVSHGEWIVFHCDWSEFETKSADDHVE